MVFWNDFIDNTIQAQDNTGNTWDMGYMNGGNYWSDYAGVDVFHGPLQNIPGSDGYGDTPYVFATAQDNYPIMEEFTTMLGSTSLIESWDDLPTVSETYEEPVTEPETESGGSSPASIAEEPVELILEIPEDTPAEIPSTELTEELQVPEDIPQTVTLPVEDTEIAETPAETEPIEQSADITAAGTKTVPAIAALAAIAMVAAGIVIYRRKR